MSFFNCKPARINGLYGDEFKDYDFDDGRYKTGNELAS